MINKFKEAKYTLLEGKKQLFQSRFNFLRVGLNSNAGIDHKFEMFDLFNGEVLFI